MADADRGAVLLKVSVELSEDLHEILSVTQADIDNPNGVRDLASAFCILHKLNAARVQGPLEQHINENVESFLRETVRRSVV
jgi:hypothetical protein